MKLRTGAVVVAIICICVGWSSWAQNQPARKEAAMSHASGTFEVKLVPQKDENNPDQTLGRMSLDKQFHGDLEAAGKGQMLFAGAAGPKGSGGYVAIEKVTGTLHGRSGSFVLQHSGTMNRGAQQLSVTVVPDSGTDQLAGLTGKMDIKIVDGKHYYEFDYRLE